MKDKKLRWEIKICHENPGTQHWNALAAPWHSKNTIEGRAYLVNAKRRLPLKTRAVQV